MKISGPGQIQSKSIQKSNKKKSSDGSLFTKELGETGDTSQTANVSSAAPLAAVNSLLSLQEVPDAPSGRSKGLARAEDMLDMLEDIRRGLLLGSIPMGNLRGLADLARRQRGETGDPQLDALLKDIELRAEVELAKFSA